MKCPAVTSAVRTLGVAALAIAIGGCASRSGSTEAESRHDVLVVIPLNVMTTMPEDLRHASPLLWEELTAYLSEQGKQLKTLSEESARQTWADSVRDASRDSESPDAHHALELFVQRLASATGFDAVVVPSLALREARLSGRHAYWDGESQLVEFVADGRNARTIARRTSVAGKAPASSLHVVVIDAAGRELHDRLQPIDLLVRARVEAGPGATEAERIVFVRRKPFEDYDRLRLGVRESLAPFVPLASEESP